MPQTVGISALSVAANSVSTERLSGTLLETAPQTGALRIFAKASATGLNLSFSAGGVTVMDDQVIPFTGTAGTLTINENMVLETGVVAGSRLQLRFRNTTGSAITVDALIQFTEM